MRFVSIIAISVAFAPAASADVSFSLDFGSEDMTMGTLEYECGEEQPFDVHYLTSETDVLALVPVDGIHRIFVNVVSASGARYVSGQYEWWTKGENATLTDMIEDESLLDCTSNSQ
ncbi:MliC family protein [Paracoccus aerodenitrificans]|uniref:MliC family protein n=1 Tax=Paracoccus aerodenitrificans TaxID=3017781 RepID=UPI0022F0AB6C|nr:MliC family protein [Paracoccus aerodenitrificans]WBU62612.1 MliC family protein [Paracoccus aerodenitrificans]